MQRTALRRDINASISNHQTKSRGRLLGVDIDPALIRRARLDAGLSMSQLGGSHVTRQAIFLIETGKTRPSMQTLEIIASRTGKTVRSFLKDSQANPQRDGRRMIDARVEELQALCLQQQFDAAIALGLPLLDRPMAPKDECQIRHYVGQALVRSMRPDEGLAHLRRAKSLLKDEPDQWLEIECSDWEACALYLKEDSSALSVAEGALKLCRATEPRLPGTEARILEHIASIHVKNHSYDLAISFYNEALRAAGTMRDLPRLGRTYHGLSIAYQERGELGRAIEYTHKALALYALEHDRALQANGENELGLLLMRQGQTEGAEKAFRSALVHLQEAGTERTKSHVLLSLGELQLKRGRLDDGIQLVKESINLAKRLDERLAQADGHVLLAQLYVRADNSQLADKEFRVALKLLSSEGLSARLAETHASYAEALDARGDARTASKHWKQAAKLALARPAQASPARAV